MRPPSANGTSWLVDASSEPPSHGDRMEMTSWPSISRSPGGTVIGTEEAGLSASRKPSAALRAAFSLAEPVGPGVVVGRVVLVVGRFVVVGGRVVVATAAVVVVASAGVVVAGASAAATPPGDAQALTGQATTLAATRASAAARRRLPLVQDRPAVATFRVVLISVGISTTVRGPCARRTEERYPESWPCLLFRGTTGRYGRDGNYLGFCGQPSFGYSLCYKGPPRLLRAHGHADHVHGLEALGALLNLELDRLVLFQGAVTVPLDSFVVDEDIRNSLLRYGAIALFRAKPLLGLSTLRPLSEK